MRVKWENCTVKELLNSGCEFYIDGDKKEVVFTKMLMGLFEDEDPEVVEYYSQFLTIDINVR